VFKEEEGKEERDREKRWRFFLKVYIRYKRGGRRKVGA